jgi:hypothetical protein
MRPKVSFILVLAAVLFLSTAAFAQKMPGVAVESDSVAPAPPSIGADVPLTYFGPAPSTVQRELVGPYQLLRSGMIDFNAGTITLPFYQGQMKDGRKVWYILTDTDDKGNADALGLNYAPKLTYADVGKAVRTATLEKNATLTFDRGTVDFKPQCTIWCLELRLTHSHRRTPLQGQSEMLTIAHWLRLSMQAAISTTLR